MIDPANITDFNRSDRDLEEFAVYAVLVAGKTAKTIAPRMEKAFNHLKYNGLMNGIQKTGETNLSHILEDAGIGWYNKKAHTLWELSYSVRFCELNLRECLPQNLELIKGIGLKTSRFFLLHSRPNARIAAIDTHILKGLALWFDQFGPERMLEMFQITRIPKSTPTNPKEYRKLENFFLWICDTTGRDVAELDLEWWRKFSGNEVD